MTAVTPAQVCKGLRDAARAALAQGWRVEMCGPRNHHLRWIAPTGGLVITSNNERGDLRMHKNAKRDLRRKGLVL